MAALAVALAAWPSNAPAEDFPTKTVRIIVPQSPGGATDTFARAIGQKLSERWKHPVIVENRAGAAGIIGTEAVAKAPADGYTLLVSYEGSQAINPSLYEKLPFDSVKDFETIATLGVTPFLFIVGPQNKAKTLREFLDMARADPDKLNYGSAGNGSVNHLLGEMLKVEADVRIAHVPYKGAPQAISDVIGGHLDAAFASAPSVMGSVQQGLVRALAVSSAQRVAISPDTPTIAESGVKDFDVNPWWGIFGPAGLSSSIVNKINSDVAEILKEADFKEVLAKQGATPLTSSPEQFRALLVKDIAKWEKAVKAAGIKMKLVEFVMPGPSLAGGNRRKFDDQEERDRGHYRRRRLYRLRDRQKICRRRFYGFRRAAQRRQACPAGQRNRSRRRQDCCVLARRPQGR